MDHTKVHNSNFKPMNDINKEEFPNVIQDRVINVITPIT